LFNGEMMRDTKTWSACLKFALWALLAIVVRSACGAPTDSTASTQPPAAKVLKGWIIQQEVTDYGPVNMFITDKALRCDTPMGNVIFVPPTYDLYFFNDYTRRLTHMHRSAWLMELKSIRVSQLKMYTSKFRLSQWNHSRSEQVLGQPTDCYAFQTSEIGANVVTTHYAWVSSNGELKAAAKVLNPLLANFGKIWPPVDGLPIQMVARISVDGKQHVANEWLTKRIELGSVPVAKFDPPKGYQTVDDWMQVMSSADLDEMMGLYGGDMKRPHRRKAGSGFGY
jgi:hypothetical protein